MKDRGRKQHVVQLLGVEWPESSPVTRGELLSDAPGRAGSAAAAAGAPPRHAWPTAVAAEVGAGSGALPRSTPIPRRPKRRVKPIRRYSPSGSAMSRQTLTEVPEAKLDEETSMVSADVLARTPDETFDTLPFRHPRVPRALQGPCLSDVLHFHFQIRRCNAGNVLLSRPRRLGRTHESAP